MSFNMIHNISRNDLPVLGTHDAEGMRCEVGLARLLPSDVVAPLSCAASTAVVLPVAGAYVYGLGHSAIRGDDFKVVDASVITVQLEPGRRGYPISTCG